MKSVLFFSFITCTSAFTLPHIARQLSKAGKGILAADESIKTIGNRFEAINLENSLENRNLYRELLFSTPRLNQYISGAILFEETLENPKLVRLLHENNILIGVKVDKGLKPLYGTNNEKWCSGMDDLYERSLLYYKQGARFAKWRTVFDISDTTPSILAIKENSWNLARYARTVQEAGLVPIVEPEILMNGNHSIDVTTEIQKFILKQVYESLYNNKVVLEGTLLKPSMTLPGISNKNDITPDLVADKTLETLKLSVPCTVPGIVFLSGGLSEEDATVYLNAINKRKKNNSWNLSFSFGRALQHSCLHTWEGKKENKVKAQQELLKRARANALASVGKYNGSDTGNQNSLFIKDYTY